MNYDCKKRPGVFCWYLEKNEIFFCKMQKKLVPHPLPGACIAYVTLPVPPFLSRPGLACSIWSAANNRASKWLNTDDWPKVWRHTLRGGQKGVFTWPYLVSIQIRATTAIWIGRNRSMANTGELMYVQLNVMHAVRPPKNKGHRLPAPLLRDSQYGLDLHEDPLAFDAGTVLAFCDCATPADALFHH